jgi:hypothetical protein
VYTCYLQLTFTSALACPSLNRRYACNNNVCSESATGVESLDECQKLCGPSAVYKCVNNTCIIAPGGGSKADCEQACISPTPLKYRCVQDQCVEAKEGSSKAECDKLCGQGLNVHII